MNQHAVAPLRTGAAPAAVERLGAPLIGPDASKKPEALGR